MKISIPVEQNNLDTEVSESFGRAPYFSVYNTETSENVFFVNPATSSPGGSGIKAAQTIVDQNVDVLLTPQCGENAADVLKAANIQLYQSTNGSMKENIQAFMDGKLSLLEEIHAGFHHGGK